MIARVVTGLLATPVALLWLVLAVAFAGLFGDVVPETLGEEGDYGYCSGDNAQWAQLTIALAGVTAIVLAVAGRRRRALSALLAVVLLGAWIAVWAAGGCGIGADDELEAAVIPTPSSFELPASPFHPSTPRIPPSPAATG